MIPVAKRRILLIDDQASIHEDYRSRAVADGKSGAGFAVAWDELPEEVRESNRRAAEAIASSVESIGCDIIPMTGRTIGAENFVGNSPAKLSAAIANVVAVIF